MLFSVQKLKFTFSLQETFFFFPQQVNQLLKNKTIILRYSSLGNWIFCWFYSLLKMVRLLNIPHSILLQGGGQWGSFNVYFKINKVLDFPRVWLWYIILEGLSVYFCQHVPLCALNDNCLGCTTTIYQLYFSATDRIFVVYWIILWCVLLKYYRELNLLYV